MKSCVNIDVTPMVLEETGLKIEKMEMKALLSGKEMYYVYPNGDQVYNVICLFEVSQWQGTPAINDDESSEFAFFSLDDVRKILNPFSLLILKEAGYFKE